ncbi:tail tape measure protein [Bacillus phage BCPG1]|nr:tail tape measure protein [Bacillus phage BCPG1]
MTETLLCLNTETSLFMGEGLPAGAITEMYGTALDYAAQYAGFYGSIQDVVYNGDSLLSYDYTDAETRILAAYSGVGTSKIIMDEQEHLNNYMDWLTNDYFWCNMVYGCNPSELAKMYSDLELKAVAVMLGNTNYYKGW